MTDDRWVGDDGPVTWPPSDDLPGWKTSVSKVSTGVFRVSVVDARGHRVEVVGSDADQLVERCRVELLERGQAVGAERRIPPWVDPRTPERPWLDVGAAVPWLPQKPYLVSPSSASELRERLFRAGFVVVDASLPESAEDPERAFLKALTQGLGFDELGAGNWAAFNDRLWDFLTGEESTPHAVVIGGLDALARFSTYHFLRCVHNLLSLTEGAALADITANRQIEYFFVGKWVNQQTVLHVEA